MTRRNLTLTLALLNLVLISHVISLAVSTL
jgi:hypothetical protein